MEVSGKEIINPCLNCFIKYENNELFINAYKERKCIVMNLEANFNLPQNETQESILRYLRSYCVDNGDKIEMQNYLNEDFKRFLITLSLLPHNEGRLLEIGANPYYTSLLIRKFSNYQSEYTNYFHNYPKRAVQYMNSDKFPTEQFEFYNIDVERDDLPFENEVFDMILFCEVLEHLPNDPIKALLSIKRCLKRGGHLILSTPNVNRLENIARMIQGSNIYDPISRYGVHGRHNREYNKHELFLILSHLGFNIEIMFASDVHANRAKDYFYISDITKLIKKVKNREQDLGQYIFIRAINLKNANNNKLDWLYR